jgi:hypothetical protein
MDFDFNQFDGVVMFWSCKVSLRAYAGRKVLACSTSSFKL